MNYKSSIPIYLAGKMQSESIHEILCQFMNDDRIEFVSSAWTKTVFCKVCSELAEGHHGPCSKHVGYVRYNEHCHYKHGWCFKCDNDENMEHGRCRKCNRLSDHYYPYVNLAMSLIEKSKALIAVIDSDSAYGTIAEIAYARGLGIPCFMLIKDGSAQGIEILRFSYEEEEIRLDEQLNAYRDTYRFVSQMCEITDDIGATVESIVQKNNKKQIRTRIRHQSPIELSFLKACNSVSLQPIPQFPLGKFFLDFAFPDIRLAIELDGHEFHKTKEQRTSDAKRQRWIELNGWKLIRFTGTEIHKNINDCVRQVEQFISLLAGSQNAQL